MSCWCLARWIDHLHLICAYVHTQATKFLISVCRYVYKLYCRVVGLAGCQSCAICDDKAAAPVLTPMYKKLLNLFKCNLIIYVVGRHLFGGRGGVSVWM